MNFERLEEAIKNLKDREGTGNNGIGFLEIKTRKKNCKVVPEIEDEILNWAQRKMVDAVIWTDLPSNFKDKTNLDFNEENVIKYLNELTSIKKARAEEYIRRTPFQIRTRLRNVIEKRLGWTYKCN